MTGTEVRRCAAVVATALAIVVGMAVAYPADAGEDFPGATWAHAAAFAGRAAEPVGPWHAEITAYPRLFFGPGDRDTLLDRVDREPYTTLMNRVRSRANNGWSGTYPENDYDVNRENSNADVAKAAAFVAWMDEDGAKAEKAAQILEALDVDFTPWSYARLDGDIHIGEAIHSYVAAFDILAGTGAIDAGRLDDIADRLGTMVANFYHDYVDQLAFWGHTNFANHYIKAMSSVAMAGMVLNQRDDAMKWVSYGYTESMARLFNLMLHAGSYAEGPGYCTYSAIQHLPLMLAYDRLVGGDDTLYKRGFCLIGPDCDWQPVVVPNALDDTRQLENAYWFVDIRMPSGQYAPYDDANAYGWFNGILSGVYGDGVLAWEWLSNEMHPLYTSYIVDLAIETIATYDDAVTPEEPPYAHVVNVDGGYAVFRSGWGGDDSWAMLLAEQGPARIWGQGHEQGDNLSVTYHARGEYLLIDPGYIEWSERAVVRKGHHHNVPTADGHGPPAPLTTNVGGRDARLVDWELETPTAMARAESAWWASGFDRTLFFVEDDYPLVVDRVTSTRPHRYGVLWNGLAGGDTGDPFALTATGATWEPGDAGVRVDVAASEAVGYATLVNVHSWTWSHIYHHNTLAAETTGEGAGDRTFISVAAPYRPGEEAPRDVATVADSAGWAAVRVDGDAPVFVASDARASKAAPRHFSAAETGGAAVDFAGRVLFVRFERGVEKGELYLEGAGEADVQGLANFSAFRPGRVHVEWRPGTWRLRFGRAGGAVRLTEFHGELTSASSGVVATPTAGGWRVEAAHVGWVEFKALIPR